MAHWWSKKDPFADLSGVQKSEVVNVEEGRSDSLDLATLTAYVSTVGTPEGLTRIAGLRRIWLGPTSRRSVVDLPEWLGDLPNLVEVDLRGGNVARLPSLPHLRWGLDAGCLTAEGVDPSRVWALGIDDETTAKSLSEVLALALNDQLNCSVITVFRALEYPTDPRTRDNHHAIELWIAHVLNSFLATQTRLETFVLQDFACRSIPRSITELRSLSWLVLEGLKPETIPDEIFELPALRSLSLAGNGLDQLPGSVARARALQRLNLSGNRFSRVPDGIWDLPQLVSLNLIGCPIRTIPREVLRLKKLADLALGLEAVPLDNRGRVREPTHFATAAATLVMPPPEVAQQGLEAIKSYWRQEEESGIDYLAEAKLLIVGEAGAGKTSLAKKILDPSHRLDSGEESTEGIDVRAWHFPSAIRVHDDEGERLLERDFRVNLWDFGGQEIYHSTHQFFLTKRSVYVLVCDERKEDTDFHYWLDVVNLLSGGSPLIIVQNRKQGRAQALNVAGLRQAYPQLAGTVSLNLADNEGLEEAVAKIRKEVESLPHIGTSLPKTWRDVRVELEGDPRDYISAEEFFRICRTNGFTRDDDIRQLGGFLHDLGICLYFQDDDLLRKTVILKPEWGTGAVYRVLDDDTVIANLGVFGKEDLPRIWHEQTFAGMHAELVQLMVKFALCFPVEGEPRRYVAPQLLSPEQPAFEWADDDNLVLRYEYDVMPKGIVRRVIVALHDLIEGPLVWRTGVVLQHETARAEIIEEYHRRRLRIRLMGDDPRVLLAMIDRELTLIHRSYSEIKFSKLRPCGCPVCGASADPAMFLISDLEDFARTGDHIQCRVSRKLLDPVPLLAELSPDPMWRVGTPPVERPVPAPEVFVSYKWGGDAETLVDDLQTRLDQVGIGLVRDKTEMSYRQSVRDFMRRIGAGKAVIVVLDKGYLESENCMFELTEIGARPEFRDRVFPVVLPDAGIFKALDRLAYIEYWEQQKTGLDQAMRRVGQENLHGIRDDLDLYERIRNTMAGILDVLRDMNAPHHQAEQLVRALQERLDRD